MSILKTANREASSKPKQLRREGLIPASLYGSEIENSILLQIDRSDVDKLLKTKSKDSKVTLEVDGKNVIALLRDVGYNVVSGQVEHLNFQKLVADEMVNSSARVVLLNSDKVQELINHTLFDINYRAFPSKLVEKVEIDLDGMQVGTTIKVSDLDISKNKDIELLTDPDSLVLSIVERKVAVVEETQDDGETVQA